MQAVTNPLNTVYATKRLIGRSYNDDQTQAEAKVGTGSTEASRFLSCKWLCCASQLDCTIAEAHVHKQAISKKPTTNHLLSFSPASARQSRVAGCRLLYPRSCSIPVAMHGWR